MNPFSRICAILIFGFLFHGHSYGQTENQHPTFAVKVNLVRLLVSVRDASGGLIGNLNKEDFTVFDRGIRQEISIFERNTSLPLSIVVLIDTSASTGIKLKYETDSVLRFLRAVVGGGNPEDALALYSFNWQVRMEADFSRSVSKVRNALKALTNEGGTSLYDALYLAGTSVADRDGRHVIILVTDGGDTTSYKRYFDALESAQRADAVVYPILVVPIENEAGRNTGGEHALSTLAASTGGRVFTPAGAGQLDEAFTDILRELRTQYLLAYYPKNLSPHPDSFHPVRITVQGPSLRVSTRTGYYELND